MSEEFYFKVTKIERGTLLAREGTRDSPIPLAIADEDLWGVSLPHQCGSWEIVDHVVPTTKVGRVWPTDQAPREVAIARLSLFIQEAEQAREKLIQGQADEVRDSV